MNQEIKIAVCDDLAEDRENITRLLSEYTDKNNLYVKIEEFSSGEAFLSSDTSVYSLVFMDIFMSGMNGMETAKKLISRNSRVQIVFGSTSTEFAAEAFERESGTDGGEHLHFRYSVCRSRWKTSENSHEKGRDRCFHVYGRSGRGSASQ